MIPRKFGRTIFPFFDGIKCKLEIWELDASLADYGKKGQKRTDEGHFRRKLVYVASEDTDTETLYCKRTLISLTKHSRISGYNPRNYSNQLRHSRCLDNAQINTLNFLIPSITNAFFKRTSHTKQEIRTLYRFIRINIRIERNNKDKSCFMCFY